MNRLPTVRPSLLPVLGLFFGIAVSIGGTLGVGILRQPGAVASYLRTPWLIMLMWLAGAGYSSVGAANVSELATMIPRAGGFYVFAREAMGDQMGFAVGWSDFLANAAAVAYAAMTTVEFVARIWPGLRPHGVLAASAMIVAFAGTQWFGVRISGRVQQVASATAAVALLSLVAACFTVPAPLASATRLPPATSFVAAMVLAIQSIVVAYDGWYEPIYFAEEARRSTRQLPRAMFGGLVLVAGIYLLLNAAFLHALGVAGLAASQFPAADAARRIFPLAGDRLVSAIAAVTMVTLLNTVLMSTTRILFAVSRDGLFWNRAALVAENGTPRNALALTTVVIIALVLSGTVDRLIAMAGFFFCGKLLLGVPVADRAAPHPAGGGASVSCARLPAVDVADSSGQPHVSGRSDRQRPRKQCVGAIAIGRKHSHPDAVAGRLRDTLQALRTAAHRHLPAPSARRSRACSRLATLASL